MPSGLPVTLNGMNYASAVFVGGVVISALSYFLYGKKHYSGPQVGEEMEPPGYSS